MYVLSKSRYCRGVQCPKMLWMDRNMPEKATAKELEAVIRTGEEIEKLACSYFRDCQRVKFNSDREQMCRETEQLLRSGTSVIAEASFMYKNNFCSVDILRICGQETQLIDVNSATEIHDIYYDDMAYQYYVLTHCGVNVTQVINMHLDNTYVRQGELELDKLFKLEDCTAQVREKQDRIESSVSTMCSVAEAVQEPVQKIGAYCDKPFVCDYKPYCHRHLPEPSVFSIRRLSTEKKYSLYQQGIISFEDIVSAQPEELNDKQWQQVKASLYQEPPYIDRDALREFLGTLSYPLYHLDFETYQQAVPLYDGVKPYMQIPFQYSLHVQAGKGAEPEHYEFLGKEGTDPRRALAEQLCRQIPINACSLAFNMAFEKMVLRNLAGYCEDLSEHLMNIHDHMRDLMVPFQRRDYYCRELQGSYSIKWVLPALCAGDPELDYHALEDVHNGSEAMAAFAELPNRTPEEIVRIRKSLLAYCRLDTLAMVKILNKIYEYAEE